MLLKFCEPDAAIARLSGNALCLDCCWLIGFKRSSSPLKPMPGSIWCIPRAAAAGVSTRGTSYRLCRPDVLAIARCRALERRSAADRRTEWIISTAPSIPRWHCVRPKAAATVPTESDSDTCKRLSGLLRSVVVCEVVYRGHHCVLRKQGEEREGEKNRTGSTGNRKNYRLKQ